MDSLTEESKLTEKFLGQTRKEEEGLQTQLKRLKEQRVVAERQDAGERKKRAEALKKKALEEVEAAKRDAEAAKKEESEAEAKEEQEKSSHAAHSTVQDHKAVEKPSESQQGSPEPNTELHDTPILSKKEENLTSNETVAVPQEVVKDPDADRAEQVKRLLAENAKLKNHNDDLENQLSQKEKQLSQKEKKQEPKNNAFLLIEENEKLREETAKLKRQLQ